MIEIDSKARCENAQLQIDDVWKNNEFGINKSIIWKCVHLSKIIGIFVDTLLFHQSKYKVENPERTKKTEQHCYMHFIYCKEGIQQALDNTIGKYWKVRPIQQSAYIDLSGYKSYLKRFCGRMIYATKYGGELQYNPHEKKLGRSIVTLMDYSGGYSGLLCLEMHQMLTNHFSSNSAKHGAVAIYNGCGFACVNWSFSQFVNI